MFFRMFFLFLICIRVCLASSFEESDISLDSSVTSKREIIEDSVQEAERSRYLGLSMDGGGIRCLMTARWLLALKNIYQDEGVLGEKDHLGRAFDMIGGTSIGGILSLGLGCEIPLEEMAFWFEDRDEIETMFGINSIQDKLKAYFSLYYSQYSHTPVKRFLQKRFKKEQEEVIWKKELLNDREKSESYLRLSDLKSNVLVTSCTDSGHPYIFQGGPI